MITDQVNLDGTTERTFLGLPAAGPPVIQLNGNGLPGDGLVLGSRPASASVSGTSSAGSAIIGLNIYNFTGGAGIHIQTNGNLITGNFLGTDVNGTAAGPGNGYGVMIDSGASNNTIGGTGAGAGNVISGNSGDGIEIIGSGVTGNVVQGNFIGTNAADTAALGNGNFGVLIDNGASYNTIGGTGAGAGNVISGNSVDGIEIGFPPTLSCNYNLVQGNKIGTNAAGTAELGNGSAGVRFFAGMFNTVEKNVISGNVNEGIFINGTAQFNGSQKS